MSGQTPRMTKWLLKTYVAVARKHADIRISGESNTFWELLTQCLRKEHLNAIPKILLITKNEIEGDSMSNEEQNKRRFHVK